jgi:hypothetical protein
MKIFECQNCLQPLYFENTRCENCGLSLGYLPGRETVTALKPYGEVWRALADRRGTYRYCANAIHNVCNWLVSTDSPEEFCAACRHNRIIPDLSEPGHLEHWRLIEIAKHRLIYTLLRLRLAAKTRAEDPGGLTFDFLADVAAPSPDVSSVMTGHADGVITINLAEADDAERERRRREMQEPYRTLLGHFRHEIAHYYWDRLVAGSAAKLDDFRQIFGDERADYGEALQRYYASGAPADWAWHFVTAYATAHPWEDFAETWAHYFHMVDTLETAGSFGLAVVPKASKGLATRIDFDAHGVDMTRLIDAWIPLTFAANSMNRSMGLPDLYPFVLSARAIAKLTFVHSCIHRRPENKSRRSGIRGAISRLRRRVVKSTWPISFLIDLQKSLPQNANACASGIFLCDPQLTADKCSKPGDWQSPLTTNLDRLRQTSQSKSTQDHPDVSLDPNSRMYHQNLSHQNRSKGIAWGGPCAHPALPGPKANRAATRGRPYQGECLCRPFD